MTTEEKPKWVHNTDVNVNPLKELLLELKKKVELSITEMKSELKRQEQIRDNLKGR